MQDICENIRTVIKYGRTDIIKSLLDACTCHKFNIKYKFYANLNLNFILPNNV